MTRLRDLDSAWFSEQRYRLIMVHDGTDHPDFVNLALLEHAVTALRNVEIAPYANMMIARARDALDREVGS